MGSSPVAICFFPLKKKTKTDICNFANDTTTYACGKDLDTISSKLELETKTKTQWFKDIEMVANPSKFQLTFLLKYKNFDKKISLLMEKPLNHQIQFNSLKLP